MSGGVWHNVDITVRGGAGASWFDMDAVKDGLTHDREYTEDELWENYEYFLRKLLPVAEEAGVGMCLHPNDPPVPCSAGFRSCSTTSRAFKQAMELVPSLNHGLEFCLGCWSETGEDLEEVIQYISGRDQLFYVHFRDVDGSSRVSTRRSSIKGATTPTRSYRCWTRPDSKE